MEHISRAVQLWVCSATVTGDMLQMVRCRLHNINSKASVSFVEWPCRHVYMYMDARSKPHHITLSGCGEVEGMHVERLKHVLNDELLQSVTLHSSREDKWGCWSRFICINACCLSAVAHVCSGAVAGHSNADKTPCGVACRCVMSVSYTHLTLPTSIVV